MRVFADENKLAEYVAELPEQADKWLMKASALVSKATRSALYETNAAGMPTEPEVIDAMAEATCLQVAEWQDAGLDPTRGRHEQTDRIASTSMDGASINYADVDQAIIDQSLNVLASVAVEPLYEAGLIGGQPWVW